MYMHVYADRFNLLVAESGQSSSKPHTCKLLEYLSECIIITRGHILTENQYSQTQTITKL